MELEVLLGDTKVGLLTRSSDKGDAVSFRFYEKYREAYPRPILGQNFEDDLAKVWRTTQRLPTFFSNLLPQFDGPLRRIIATRAGVHPEREIYLLSHLGKDLPGNVIVRPLSAFDDAVNGQEVDDSKAPRNPPDALRFSLAGVQLKFSMVKDDRSLTLPVSGIGGDWIVKLPDDMHPKVPENEWSVMHWARKAGICVPDTELVLGETLKNIPEEFLSNNDGQRCYAVRRFDRPTINKRVHIEDFCQVLDLYDSRKYDAYNYETIGRIVLSVCGEDDFREFVRRLIFVVLSGNADAHHKNWSLIYPDGYNAHLSPAYDLVSTVTYPKVNRDLALNFNKSKKFSDVSRDGFRRLAGKLGRDEKQVIQWVDDDIDRILDAWRSIRAELPMLDEHKAAIDKHLQGLPLLGGTTPLQVESARIKSKRNPQSRQVPR